MMPFSPRFTLGRDAGVFSIPPKRISKTLAVVGDSDFKELPFVVHLHCEKAAGIGIVIENVL